MGKRIIILIGKPGAGKDTRLSEFLENAEGEYIVLSPGNILRKNVADKTELGLEAKKYMDSGELVPDKVINKLILSAIEEIEEGVNIILNGYPRTVEQAKTMLEAGIVPERLVHIYVGDDVVLERAAARIVCVECGEAYTTTNFKPPKVEGICDKCRGELAKRTDDSPEIVKNRLKVYSESTEPVIDCLKKEGVVEIVVTQTNVDVQFKAAMIL